MGNTTDQPVSAPVHTGANKLQVGGSHYKKFAIEVWDFIAQNNIPYLEGNAIKYIARWREKGGVVDIDKAIHYMQKLKEVELSKLDKSQPSTGYATNPQHAINAEPGDVHVRDPRVRW